MNPPTEKLSNTRSHLIWGAVLVAVIVVGFFAFRFTVNKIDAAARDTAIASRNEVRQYAKKAEALAREFAAFAERAAARFKSGTITQTFTEEIPVFRSLGLGHLEAVVSEPVPVTFHKADTRKIAWEWISLGQTVSDIRVPATYRYHVPLDGYWKLDVQDRMCIVIPPPLKASLPVAIHTDQMEKNTSNGWARFDKQEQLDALERSITPRLNELASNDAHITEARDKARLTIAKFVRAWLLREDQWGKDHFTSIVVVFPDEPPPNRQTFRPTISLQPKL